MLCDLILLFLITVLNLKKFTINSNHFLPNFGPVWEEGSRGEAKRKFLEISETDPLENHDFELAVKKIQSQTNQTEKIIPEENPHKSGNYSKQELFNLFK